MDPFSGWPPPTPDTDAVQSVFARTGAVVAQAGDYEASQVNNDSSVTGATVKDALNALSTGGGAVSSVFARTGAVVAAAGDYAASQVNNDSSVSGAHVKDALNTLQAAIPAVPVSSVFARTGAVVAQAGDYTAAQVGAIAVGAAAGGDLGGTLPNPTVNKWQGATLRSVRKWLSEVPPASPSAYDLEMNVAPTVTTYDSGSPAAIVNAWQAGTKTWLIRQQSQNATHFCGAYEPLADTTLTAFLRCRHFGGWNNPAGIVFFFLGERSAAGAWTTTDGVRGVQMRCERAANTITDNASVVNSIRFAANGQLFTNYNTGAGSSVPVNVGGTADRSVSGQIESEFILRLRLDNAAGWLRVDIGPRDGRSFSNVCEWTGITAADFKAIGWGFSNVGAVLAGSEPFGMEIDFLRVTVGSSDNNNAVGGYANLLYT